MTGTWIEAALNGPWGKAEQPGSPTTVEECIEEGVACAEAGAAIVHVHAFDPEADEQEDDPETYARIIEGINDRTDAIVYPTVPPLGMTGGETMPAEERYAHHEALGERGLLEWSVVDPGSINFTTYEAVARDEPGSIYRNPEPHVRRGLDVANRFGTSPAYAIYEPGFVRLGAALAERYPDLGAPIYRFMFTEAYTFGYPPERYALESLLRLLSDEAGEVPWMVSGLGVDVTPLIPAAVERGGGVRVGLEDAPLGTDRSNVEWVERARREIEAAGGRVATPGEVRSALDGYS
ncbi:MAG: 3-keto-5-aminohexanoate cleavage protein [Haloarculaceae archaeon]